jgi:hypothetical protein
VSETTTVRTDDLTKLITACLRYLPEDTPPDLQEAFGRLDEARHGFAETAEAELEPLPEGFFGRVEIPGMRNHTGWVTEETRFGTQLAVVRDWNGAVIAEMGIGPACRVLHLPTPLKRPDPPLAITPGDFSDEYENDPLGDEDQYRDAF